MTISQMSMPRGLLTDDVLPLFERIAVRLLDELRATGAREGDRLPSERVLAGRYAVSRVTLRAALTALEARGLVSAAPSRGWFVADIGSHTESASGAGDGGSADTTGGAASPAVPQVQGFADYAAAHGLTASSRVLSADVRAATVHEAEMLRVAPGSELFELHRVRSLDGLLVVVEHNRLPLAICPALADTDFNASSLYATLRAAVPPQLPRVADYSVEARHPTPRERQLLEIDDIMPMLVATQLTYSQADRPIELTMQAYRGDRYRFRAAITNRRADDPATGP